MFRFRLGQAVRCADYPTKRHYVGQRRWTERRILAPLVEYRLTFSATDDSWALGWVRDEDLQVWEER
jgi:hypothetical protein